MIDESPSPGASDADLRRLFSDLRSEDKVRTPPFMPASQPQPGSGVPPALLPARSARRPLAAWASLAAVAVTVLAAVLFLRRESRPPAPAQDTAAPIASITAWKPATDFLLNTPGREMLRTTPALDLHPWPGTSPRPGQRTPRLRARPSP